MNNKYTDSGIEIKNVYTASNSDENTSSELPGQFPSPEVFSLICIVANFGQ